MEYVITLLWDEEADVWVAINDIIPLALESDSLDVQIERVKQSVPELLSLNKIPIQKPISLSFNIQREL